jgi:XTP/dITP diphosphohydrolase
VNGSALLLATRSTGKLAELCPLLTAAGFAVSDLGEAGLPELPEEDALEAFDTFEENARAKARYFHARSGGRAVVAEDSGLEVAALGGAPGVHSKRWSARSGRGGEALDEANNAELLARLGGVRDRRARYVCVAVYWDGEREVVARGETTGWITEARRGGAHGFGYDPYFVSDELGRAFSEVTREEKARVSHRARAVAQLVKSLVARG